MLIYAFLGRSDVNILTSIDVNILTSIDVNIFFDFFSLAFCAPGDHLCLLVKNSQQSKSFLSDFYPKMPIFPKIGVLGPPKDVSKY